MNFITRCPAMPVRNTGWGATTNRLTDVCVGTALLPLPNGSTLSIAVVFPQSLVTYRSPGKWRVEALTGDKIVKVYDASDVEPDRWTDARWMRLFAAQKQIGTIEFPAEPVERTGPRTMTAKSIMSTKGTLTVNNVLGDLKITLPDVDADPFPWHRGGQLGGFTVRACACHSEVTWH